MKPPEEEINLCKKLPPHEWEVGDWALLLDFIPHDPLRMVILNKTEDKSKVMTIGVSIKGDQYRCVSERLVWLPHPHQIMELDVWPEFWMLDYDSYHEDFGVVKHKTRVDSCTLLRFISAPTARLACLRALENGGLLD